MKNDSQALFPLAARPSESFKTGMRAFNSNRSKGLRKHAGCDLYAPVGTAIRAMHDGIVINEYNFYLGTRALEIKHGNAIYRYGEISHTPEKIKIGSTVKKGDIIAYVGELKFKDGSKMSMLHLEIYSGSESGPLTVRANKPYQRRLDLIDSTPILESATMTLR